MMRISLGVVILAATAMAQESPQVMKITQSVTLEKNAVLRTPLIIEADGVTIDGNGATIQGPGEPGKLPTFAGTGVQAAGRSRVSIRNLKIKGFRIGLAATDGTDWLIEGCDLSDNYHDPDYGWGDLGPAGGIALTRISKSRVNGCTANRVWNGLDLVESNENVITKNDFSHCSNVCLKMWTASGNSVDSNNLSYGLRISPGEVHARDSTSVLIESGSDHNTFLSNDITHGGDGVFIRVLNGWCSRYNSFVLNDCSYANNNGFEAWSPDNTYIKNKANHCSYGFWLGGSDHTVLSGNEAAYNGMPDGFHNAPEPDFHHGGIVIVGGSGSHTVIDDNFCHHNAGAGIVFRGDLESHGQKWKMYHLIVQNNRLEDNKWGLFARFTHWLTLSNNQFKNNENDELFEEVTGVDRLQPPTDQQKSPTVRIQGPAQKEVGQAASFRAISPDATRIANYRWEIAGRSYTGVTAEHVFDKPGFYRVGLTVDDGRRAGLTFLNFYAFEPVRERPTEGGAYEWDFEMGNNADHKGNVEFVNDSKTPVVGVSSLRATAKPYTGTDVSLIYPKSRKAAWDLGAPQKQLSFWIKFQNPNQGGFGGPNPIIRLHSGKAAFSYLPAFKGRPRSLLTDLPYSEARYGWLYVTIPLAGSDEWLRSETLAGARPPHIDNALKFVTSSTPLESQSGSAMASTGDQLYCALIDGDRLLRSSDGKQWDELKNPSDSLHLQQAWINGMLTYWPRGGDKGRLYLHHIDPKKDQFGSEHGHLTAYDIATDTWSVVPTATILGHGAVVIDDYIYGIAHAIMGNYGGPVCRVNLAHPGEFDERTVLAPVKGKESSWFSRAGQLAVVDGRIYATKNDWQTPQPKEADQIGDRLMMFEPKDFKASKFDGGHLWKDSNWHAANTPTKDLGPLPFEIGHGSALVALPPKWCPAVGAQGGLFLVAGCAPADHEGNGPPSAHYAIYDIATARFTLGMLPDATGTGTSACLHKGVLFIKRGGMNYGPSNGEIWMVTPLTPEEAGTAEPSVKRERMNLKQVDYLSIQFDSSGNEPFDVWLDGLSLE